MIKFLRENIFSGYNMPCAIICDQGTNFNNRSLDLLLRQYSIIYRLASPCPPKISEQVEVFSMHIKHILERTVNRNRKDWADRLIDASWAYRTTFKMPLGMLPFRVVHGKPYHLPVELEHRKAGC